MYGRELRRVDLLRALEGAARAAEASSTLLRRIAENFMVVLRRMVASLKRNEDGKKRLEAEMGAGVWTGAVNCTASLGVGGRHPLIDVASRGRPRRPRVRRVIDNASRGLEAATVPDDKRHLLPVYLHHSSVRSWSSPIRDILRPPAMQVKASGPRTLDSCYKRLAATLMKRPYCNGCK